MTNVTFQPGAVTTASRGHRDHTIANKTLFFDELSFCALVSTTSSSVSGGI
jgi:hypothetical protein